jgi:hypothetical protein
VPAFDGVTLWRKCGFELIAQVLAVSENIPNIQNTLEERGARYGAFTEHARIAQNLKRAMVDSSQWEALADDQKEALEMVQHKIARILNGQPDYHESWHDIVGYAQLVANRLEPQVLAEDK